MNPAQLLEHFDRIGEAPDAVARLRRFILDLAVRGKLVEQDSDDEPAAELLKRIQVEKATDVAGTRKQAVITKVGDSDVPFPAPLGWLWLRFGLVHDLVRGVTYTKSDVAETQVADYLPILRANNIGASLNFDDLVFVRQECIGPDQMLRRGDYLIALSSGSKNLVGKAAFVDADHPCGFGGFCGVIRLISPSLEQFVGVFLSSRLYRDAISAGSRGIGINNLKRETLNEALFHLPPLAEQHRIVAKVDELMALCDQLEAAKNEREARRDRLVAASLHRIGTAPAAADEAATVAQSSTPLRDAARFHLDHLPRLTTRPEHIKQLRQTILNLAVRGHLVPQDKKEVEVRIALTEAFEVKRNMIRRSELPKRALPVAAYLSTSPFELPINWAFVNFDHLAAPVLNALKAGPFGSALKKDSYISQGYKVYGQEQVIGQDPEIGDYYISDAKFNQLKSCAVAPGDLLISLVGTIGKVLVLPPGCQEGIINPRLIKLTLNIDLVNPKFVQLLLGSPWVREFLFAEARGTTMDVLNLTILRSLPVPLPPLAEQHRIVAKVNELTALCDQLEAQLTTTQADSRCLLEAVLHEALNSSAEMAG